MTTHTDRPQSTTAVWQGIHHIALATPDLDATRRFYAEVLGMAVSEAYAARDGRGRHCLVLAKPGDSETLGLHFFERTITPPLSYPATLANSAANGGAMLHLALRLSSEGAAERCRHRLLTHGVAVTEIPELGSFVFSDNNGILLEVTWPHQ